MNYSHLARNLTKRFSNAGARRLHEWSRTQYGRIVSYGRSTTSLDNINTESVFMEVEKAINCFHELKPADFVKWFRLVPAIDQFGKSQPCVEPTSFLYADLINAGNGNRLTYTAAIVKGNDLIEIPSSDRPFVYQQSADAGDGEIKGVALSISEGNEVATTFLTKADCQHIIAIHTETKYRCNSLSNAEWDDLLIAACFRRIMSEPAAGKWIHAMSVEDRANIDLVIEFDNKCYVEHKDKRQVTNSVTGRVVAEQVYVTEHEDKDILAMASKVRKALNVPDEGCDAQILALDKDAITESLNKKTVEDNVVAINPKLEGAAAGSYDPYDIENLEWGV